MSQLKSTCNPNSETFKANAEHMQSLINDLREKAEHIAIGGNKNAREKHISRGKLLVRERINTLIDAGSAFLELSQFAAFGVCQCSPMRPGGPGGSWATFGK